MRYRYHRIGTVIVCCALQFASGPSAAALLSGESVLLQLEKARSSIVSILAQNGGIMRGEQGAFIDPATKKIVTARRIRAGMYQREGAGIVIDATGIIVTNAHTIIRADRIIVTLPDGRSCPAQPIDLIADEDIAFLRIAPAEGLVPIEMADSDRVLLKEIVYAIGTSDVRNGTFTAGHITGIGERAQQKMSDTAVDIIQTDFSVYQGDSGGPLLDKDGRLLGLFTAARRSPRVKSFAVPVNRIRRYLRAIMPESPLPAPESK